MSRVPIFRTLSCPALVLVVSLLAGCGGTGYDLVIGSRERGEILKRIPMQAGEEFRLDYTHSSEKTPIHDTFVISENGAIVLTEERFDWYAVGLEFRSREGEASVDFDGRETRVSLNRLFPVLPIRVGWVADQSITAGGERLELKEIARGGTLLEIWTEAHRSGGTSYGGEQAR